MVFARIYWNKQLAYVIVKLNQGTVVLNKLRHKTNLDILKIVYHSLVKSHLYYGAKL